MLNFRCPCCSCVFQASFWDALLRRRKVYTCAGCGVNIKISAAPSLIAGMIVGVGIGGYMIGSYYDAILRVVRPQFAAVLVGMTLALVALMVARLATYFFKMEYIFRLRVSPTNVS